MCATLSICTYAYLCVYVGVSNPSASDSTNADSNSKVTTPTQQLRAKETKLHTHTLTFAYEVKRSADKATILQ